MIIHYYEILKLFILFKFNQLLHKDRNFILFFFIYLNFSILFSVYYIYIYIYIINDSFFRIKVNAPNFNHEKFEEGFEKALSGIKIFIS